MASRDIMEDVKSFTVVKSEKGDRVMMGELG